MGQAFQFNTWLRQQRKARDLTQQELAAQTGYAISTIRKLEAGVLRPSHHLARQLANVLHLTPEEVSAMIKLARTRPDPARAGADAAQFSATLADVSAAATLPVPSTPLIGREPNIARVCAQVQQPEIRLVTLTGPGSVGKTRIAIAAAQALAPQFADGVRFVPLAAVTDPRLVVPAIAQAVRLRDRGLPATVARVAGYLRDKHLLLILDNVEQVAAAATDLAELLAAALHLTLLVTSRVALRLSGEHILPVQPLPLPPRAAFADQRTLLQYPSVDLFMQRRAALQPGLAITADLVRTVAEICVRVDGLPLALELAASRSATLSMPDMLVRLDQRLPLLTMGSADQPVRQRTMRATLDWSYALLDPDARTLLARLSVFAGGWTLDGAEALGFAPGDAARSTLDVLESLVDHSLVYTVDGPDGLRRFGMYEVIRKYAHERLVEHGEAAIVRRQHAQFFVTLAESAEIVHDSVWLIRLEQEQPNLRAALRWLIEQRLAEPALRLATSLAWFWIQHGHLSEGYQWLTQALEIDDAAAPTLQAKALGQVGGIAYRQGAYAPAIVLLDASLTLYRTLGDHESIAWLAANLGVALNEQSEWERALALSDESLDLFQMLDFAYGTAWAVYMRAEIALVRADYDEAARLLANAVARFRALPDQHSVATALARLGDTAVARAEYRVAGSAYAESLTLFLEREEKMGIAATIEGCAGLTIALIAATPIAGESSAPSLPVARTARAAVAIQLLGAAAALREIAGAPLPASARESYNHALRTAHTLLDDATFAAAWAEGRMLTLEDIALIIHRLLA